VSDPAIFLSVDEMLATVLAALHHGFERQMSDPRGTMQAEGL
jgi:hypothetical protein